MVSAIIVRSGQFTLFYEYTTKYHNSYAHQVGLEVRAMTDIKAGHEVLIQYGTRSDDELLLNYGFVLGPGPGVDKLRLI